MRDTAYPLALLAVGHAYFSPFAPDFIKIVNPFAFGSFKDRLALHPSLSFFDNFPLLNIHLILLLFLMLLTQFLDRKKPSLAFFNLSPIISLNKFSNSNRPCHPSLPTLNDHPLKINLIKIHKPITFPYLPILAFLDQGLNGRLSLIDLDPLLFLYSGPMVMNLAQLDIGKDGQHKAEHKLEMICIYCCYHRVHNNILQSSLTLPQWQINKYNMDPPGNTTKQAGQAIDNNSHVTFTPVKKGARDLGEAGQGATPSTFERTHGRGESEIRMGKKEEEYGEIPVAYSWSSMSYRQSRYYGKTLLTQYLPQPQSPKSPKSPLPHTSTLSHLHPHKSQQEYKHGPGILILNNNLWIIGKWSYDRLVGDRCYVIGADLGLMELRLSKEMGGGDIGVEEVCFVGDGGGKGKYAVLGTRGPARMWKWVISQQDSPNQHSYLQTQQQPHKTRTNELAHRLLQHRLINQQQAPNSNPNPNPNHQIHSTTLQQFISYPSIVVNIKSILIEGDSQQQQGFVIQEQSKKVVNSSEVPHRLSMAGEETVTEMLVYGGWGSEVPYFRARAVRRGERGQDWFRVQELGTARRGLGQTDGRDMGNKEYEYRVEAVCEQKGKDGCPQPPTYQVQQHLSSSHQHRYRYTLSPNIFNSPHSPSQLHISQSREYTLSQQQKTKLNLRSLKFVNKSHRKLGEQIQEMVLAVQTAYYYARMMKWRAGAVGKGDRSGGRIEKVEKEKEYAYTDRLGNKEDSFDYLTIKYDRSQLSITQSSIGDLKNQLSKIRLADRKKKQLYQKKAKPKQTKRSAGKIYGKIISMSPRSKSPSTRKHLNTTMPQTLPNRTTLIQSIYQHRNQKQTPKFPTPTPVFKYLSQYPQAYSSNPELLELTREYHLIDRELVETSVQTKIPMKKPCQKDKLNNTICCTAVNKDKGKELRGRAEKYSRVGLVEGKEKGLRVIKKYL